MKKLIVFATAALVVWYWLSRHINGVEFTLKNVGPEALRSVTVDVTGKSYAIGDLLPGRSKTVKVNPLGESHIGLRFREGRVLTIDCYMEHDYGGRIEANVTSQAVVTVKDEITLPSLF
jgi:hypothetical protein